MRHRLGLLVFATMLIVICCSCFLDEMSDENGITCCCVVPGMDPYWTHADFCGGKSVACYRAPDSRANLCPPKSASSNSRSELAMLFLDHEAIQTSFTHSPSARLLLSKSVSSSGSCLQKCSSGVSDANCTVTRLSAQDSQSLKDFYDRLNSDAKLKLLPKEFKSMFHVTQDPCDRGAIVVNKKDLTNDGETDCSLTTRLENVKMRIQVLVPKNIRGVWASRNSPMKLDFNAPDDAPVLRFLKLNEDAPDELDSEWGGRVLFAESDGKQIAARTIGGCVGVVLK